MGGGIASAVGRWLVIGRWWSFYTDFVAVTVGSALALPRFSASLYIAMLIATVSLNAFANFVNDIYDFRHGEGSIKGAMPRYPNPLIDGLVSVSSLWSACVVALAIAVACGLYLYMLKGVVVVLLGMVGIVLAYAYSAGGRSIKSMALGELAVFIVYGPLMTGSAYFIESGGISVGAALTSVIIGIAIMLVLFANNIRDIRADRATGVVTLAGLLGRRRSLALFGVCTLLMYALLLAFVLESVLPVLASAALLSAPYALRINIEINRVPDNSAELTSRLALLFSVLLSAGIMAQQIMPML